MAEQGRVRTSPNVLFIMCDQLNARVLGCYGGDVPTPNIDRLAREGIVFTDAVCNTPFCSPSRASIITGMYPHSHGITYNVMRRDYPMVKSPPTEEGIKKTDVTTERILSASGYATHHYGKWHLLDDDLPYYRDMYTEHDAYAKEMAAVFSRVRQTDPTGWMNWYDWILPVDISPAFRNAVKDASTQWKDRPYIEFVAKMGRLKLPLARTFDVRVADKTIERIRAVNGRAFMITCSFNSPHDPNVIASPYYEMFDPLSIKLPDNLEYREARFEDSWSRQMVAGFSEDGLREFLRVYYASVKMIDDQVGRIVHALEETEQLDSTLIVFTADHGDMAGGHGMAWKSNGSFYDEIVRVPLIMRYPARFQPQSCSLAVDLTDIMPTLLAVTGHAIPKQVEGQNLVPLVTGQRDAATARSYGFAERVGAARPRASITEEHSRIVYGTWPRLEVHSLRER